jgi:prevent-host-death family protein
MGLREANQHFSRAVKAVKAGEEVVLTERGKPIAVLKPVAAKAKAEAGLQQLEAAGLLRRATKPGPMPPWRPRPLKKGSLSAAIREERDTI